MLFITTMCKAQDNDELWYTLHPKHLDSAYRKEVRVLHFKHSTGVIFPVSYAKVSFGSQDTYFMPDTSLIKKIEPQIIGQYCNAIFKLNEGNLKELIERSEDKKEKEKYKNAIKTEKASIDKFCNKWKDSLINYDSQYIGYVMHNGERVIRVNIVNLNRDYSDLKKVLNILWLVTPFDAESSPVNFSGWFYVDRNLLSINPIK